MIQHINKPKEKSHPTISLGTERALDKVQHSFMIKTVHNIGTGETDLNMARALCENPTAYIIINKKTLRAYPLCPGQVRMPPLLLLFAMVPEILLRTMRQEEKKNILK